MALLSSPSISFALKSLRTKPCNKQLRSYYSALNSCGRPQSRHLTRHCSITSCLAQEGKGKAAAMAARVLITFDVDGTLMHSVGLESNKLHKDAFAYSFRELFGVDGTIDAIKHHGSTDLTVASRTLQHYGVAAEVITPKLQEVKAKMLEYVQLHEEEVGDGLELLPGVADLLQILSRHPDVVVGLVTGNLEPIAWLKMKGLGVLQFFSTPNFGGFGSDHTDRGELVKIAASRADELFPGPPFALRVHVGDTPNDILAAEYGGALPVGVCTGVFTEGELKAAGKTGKALLLAGLSDIDGFLKACGLRRPESA